MARVKSLEWKACIVGILGLCLMKLVTGYLNTPSKTSDYYTWFQDTDHYTWMLNTIEAHKEGLYTIHDIKWDGGLTGREHHWSMGLLSVLRIGGLFTATITGLPFETALGVAQPITTAILYSLLIIISYLAASHLLGPPIAGWLTLAVYANAAIIPYFSPIWLDHPAILIFSLFLYLLGIFGLLFSKQKGAAATISALGATIGIWTSAINMVPIILPTAFALLITILLGGVHVRNIRPMYWKLWGIVASSSTLLLYMLEYEIGDPILLENNNLLYVLSIFAGGYVLAYAKPFNWKIVPAGLLTATPLIYKLFFGIKTTMETSYFKRHMELINEAQPMGDSQLWLFSIIIIAVTITVYLCNTNRIRDWTLVIPFGFGGFMLSVIALLTARVLPYAMLTLLFLVFTTIFITKSRLWRKVLFGLIICGILLGFSLAITQVKISPQDSIKNKFIQDIVTASKLIKEDAKDRGIPIKLLTQIETAPVFAFYTQGTTYGGPYWEAIAQLRVSSKLMTTTNMEEAGKMLSNLGVTYIAVNDKMALFSYPLLGEVALSGNAKWFGSRIAYPINTPRFLVPLRNSKGQIAPEGSFMLYRTNYDQN